MTYPFKAPGRQHVKVGGKSDDFPPHSEKSERERYIWSWVPKFYRNLLHMNSSRFSTIILSNTPVSTPISPISGPSDEFLSKFRILCYIAGIMGGRSSIGGPPTHICTESGAKSTGNHLNWIPVKFGHPTPSIVEVMIITRLSEKSISP